MTFKISSSPHQSTDLRTGALMRMVFYLSIPGIYAQAYFFGVGVVWQICLCSLVAVASEAAVLKLRNRPVRETLKDCSALLTALLLAISLPPLAPWWIGVIGTFFAIVVVKQLFGGLGFNPFNPAMVAYVLLLISFPVEMTSWMPPLALAQEAASFGDSLWVIFSGSSLDGLSADQMRLSIDGVTMATPLDTLKTDLMLGMTAYESQSKPVFSALAGEGWEWVNLAYLAGGLIMIKTRVIRWHIPAGFLGALFLLSLIGYLVHPDGSGSPLFHLFSGATMLGAFFIATDPVSAATTVRGRLLYGALIGTLIYLIRSFGGYPDAVAFAVILSNCAVPLIDQYTQPRVYGQRRQVKPAATEGDSASGGQQ